MSFVPKQIHTFLIAGSEPGIHHPLYPDTYAGKCSRVGRWKAHVGRDGMYFHQDLFGFGALDVLLLRLRTMMRTAQRELTEANLS